MVLRKAPLGAALLVGSTFGYAGVLFQNAFLYSIATGQGIDINGQMVTSGPALLLPLLLPIPFWLVGAYSVLAYVNGRYVADDIGLKEHGLFGQVKAQIPWAEVRSIKSETGKAPVLSGGLLIVAESGAMVRIGANLPGRTLLVAEILNRVKDSEGVDVSFSENVIPPVERGLARLNLSEPHKYAMYGMWAAVFGFGWTGFVVFFGVLVLSTALTGQWLVALGVAPILVGFLAVGLWLIGMALKQRLVLTESGVDEFDVLGRLAFSAPWSAFEGFEFESSQSNEGQTIENFVLRAGDEYVRIWSYMPHFEELRNEIMARVPDSARVTSPR